MKSKLLLLLLLIGAGMLSSHLPSGEKPKQAPNSWSYKFYQLKPDTSIWSNLNYHQIDFVKRDSSGKPSKYIGLSFTHKPTKDGVVYTSSWRDTANEVTILACDKEHCYRSKQNGTPVYLSFYSGKLHAWANNVKMEEMPKHGSQNGHGDSVQFSFNLSEF